MTECPFNDAAWLIGTMPQMGLVLISVMAVTGDGVDLSHVHSPGLCPHTGGRMILIDKRDKKTQQGASKAGKERQRKRDLQKESEKEGLRGRKEIKAKNKDNNRDEKKIGRQGKSGGKSELQRCIFSASSVISVLSWEIGSCSVPNERPSP